MSGYDNISGEREMVYGAFSGLNFAELDVDCHSIAYSVPNSRAGSFDATKSRQNSTEGSTEANGDVIKKPVISLRERLNKAMESADKLLEEQKVLQQLGSSYMKISPASPGGPNSRGVRRTLEVPNLSVPVLERCPEPVSIPEWHRALSEVAVDARGNRIPPSVIRSITEQRISNEYKLADTLFESYIRLKRESRDALVDLLDSSSSDSTSITRDMHSSDTPSLNTSSLNSPKTAILRSALTQAQCLQLFAGLCSLTGEKDYMSLRLDSRFALDCERLAKSEPLLLESRLRMHIFHASRLASGAPWVPYGVKLSSLSSVSSIGGNSSPNSVNPLSLGVPRADSSFFSPPHRSSRASITSSFASTILGHQESSSDHPWRNSFAAPGFRHSISGYQSRSGKHGDSLLSVQSMRSLPSSPHSPLGSTDTRSGDIHSIQSRTHSRPTFRSFTSGTLSKYNNIDLIDRSIDSALLSPPPPRRDSLPSRSHRTVSLGDGEEVSFQPVEEQVDSMFGEVLGLSALHAQQRERTRALAALTGNHGLGQRISVFREFFEKVYGNVSLALPHYFELLEFLSEPQHSYFSTNDSNDKDQGVVHVEVVTKEEEEVQKELLSKQHSRTLSDVSDMSADSLDRWVADVCSGITSDSISSPFDTVNSPSGGSFIPKNGNETDTHLAVIRQQQRREAQRRLREQRRVRPHLSHADIINYISENTRHPIVPRGTVLAAVSDLRSFTRSITSALLNRYTFLRALPTLQTPTTARGITVSERMQQSASAFSQSPPNSNSNVNRKKTKLVSVDHSSLALHCLHEAVHIAVSDTLQAVFRAHVGAQDIEALQAFQKLFLLPPCVYGLSHAFCADDEPGCTRLTQYNTEGINSVIKHRSRSSSNEVVEEREDEFEEEVARKLILEEPELKTDSSTDISTDNSHVVPITLVQALSPSPKLTKNKGTEPGSAAAQLERCYTASIDALLFLSNQRSPLTKLGALRVCFRGIEHGTLIEKGLVDYWKAKQALKRENQSPHGSKDAISSATPGLKEKLNVGPIIPPTPQQLAVGADDLVPRLCFVLVRTKLMHLASQISYLEDCMPEDKALGEDGYAVVSLRGALMHCIFLGNSLFTNNN